MSLLRIDTLRLDAAHARMYKSCGWPTIRFVALLPANLSSMPARICCCFLLAVLVTEYSLLTYTSAPEQYYDIGT